MTTAIPSDVLAMQRNGVTGQPLCPGCVGGYLHPYLVEVSLRVTGGWHGVDYLTGWVAVCVGNGGYKRAHAGEDLTGLDDVEPCGFSMQLTPHRHRRPEGML